MGLPYGTEELEKNPLSAEVEDEILATVGLQREEASELLAALNMAVGRAKATKEMEDKLSREGLKKSFARAAKSAEEFAKRLEEIPIAAGAVYFLRQGISKAESEKQARILAGIVRIASDMANEELSGRGADRSDIPATLAADIAQALQNIHVPTHASRPSYNQAGAEKASIYWRVAQICFQQSKILVSDLRDALRDGVAMVEKRHHVKGE
ncbi:hypothetical protein [Geomonas agri]|uniref:hypothetical protein n=1 Tax=Geomonas agri TaxID=2873702 RepID=UPI001CD72C7D|nr:hypothetical protein [Geomonas agri]